MSKKSIIAACLVAFLLSLSCLYLYGKYAGWKLYLVSYIPLGAFNIIAATEDTLFGDAYYHFIVTDSKLDRLFEQGLASCRDSLDSREALLNLSARVEDIFSGAEIYVGTNSTNETAKRKAPILPGESGDRRAGVQPANESSADSLEYPVIVYQHRICRVDDALFGGVVANFEAHISNGFVILSPKYW